MNLSYLLFLIPVLSFAQDAPDLDYETKLHDIYINYHSKKMSTEQWNDLAQGRQSENYQIQNGDTLWGISQTFFSDGNYWPKIWSINNRIENPHLIKKGNTIRFLLGDESDAPSFTVSEGEGEDTSEESETTEVTVSDGGADIPPPATDFKPVLRKIPPSLPQWQSDKKINEYDITGFSAEKARVYNLKDTWPLVAYIEEGEPESLGSVVEVEGDGTSAAQYQYVYVRVKKGEAKVGDKLLSISNRGQILRIDPSIQGRLGNRVEVEGAISLSELAESRENSDKYDLFRGMVTESVNPVRQGSPVIKGSIPAMNLSEDGPRSDVVAQIIGGQYDQDTRVFGVRSIAFLNRGSQDGLKVGDILPVRANRELRKQGSLVIGNHRTIGMVKIVKITPTFSTAVVLRSTEQIMAGDVTGRGELVAAPKTADRLPLESEELKGEEPKSEGSKSEDDIQDSDLE